MTQPPNNPGIFVRKPMVAFLFSLVLGLFFAYVLVMLISDLNTVPSDPEQLLVTTAPQKVGDDRLYASLVGGVWDCETIQYVTGPSSSNLRRETTRFTEAFLTDAAGEVLVFASMSGEISCEELMAENPAGYLTLMSEDKQQELINEVRLAKYINAKTYLELCGYCGPENSWIGVIMSAAALILLLAFFPLMLRANRRWKETT